MIRRNNSGQGVLELIIAIGIIVSSLGATFGLLLVTSQTSNASRSRILAANLAREGIEVVRSIRDSNWLAIDTADLASSQWMTGLQSATESGDYTGVAVFRPLLGTWELNFTPDTLDATTVMYWNPTTGVFSQWPSLSVPDVLLNLGPGFQGVRYWRFLTLRPICWNLTGAQAEQTELIPGIPCSGLRTQVGVEVNVRVQWERRGRIDTIDITEKMFNWKI